MQTQRLLNAAIAGAAAVWIMDRLDWFAFAHEDRHARRRTEAVRPNGMDPAHALAEKAAEATGTSLTPAPPHQHPAGLAVHYAIPIGLTALYDVLRHRFPSVAKGSGALYGMGVFLLLDEVVNPALGLAARPDRYPWQRHARELTAHLIYGVVSNAVLQALVQSRPARSKRPI